MYTSLTILALFGFFAARPAHDGPAWLRDYAAAKDLVQIEHKPLAVFIGSGPSGWEKVAREGKPSKEIARLLAEHYVCLHVDSATDAGKRLAKAFEVSQETGLVISDKTGNLQAFCHEGN